MNLVMCRHLCYSFMKCFRSPNYRLYINYLVNRRQVQGFFKRISKKFILWKSVTLQDQYKFESWRHSLFTLHTVCISPFKTIISIYSVGIRRKILNQLPNGFLSNCIFSFSYFRSFINWLFLFFFSFKFSFLKNFWI